MQIPKPLPTPCISLVASIDVVAHVVEDEVAEVGEEVIVREVVATSSHAGALPKNLIAPLPYRIQRGEASETYSPVDRVRGGRDGVTGGSSSKGTTVGVRVSRCDLFVAARDRRRRILIGAAVWRDVGSTHVRVRDSPRSDVLDRGPAVRKLSVSDWQK